jgi:hypothetical protein
MSTDIPAFLNIVGRTRGYGPEVIAWRLLDECIQFSSTHAHDLLIY